MAPEYWDLARFAGVGALAQLVDGALGMGYGVVCSTVLMSMGVLPASVSASVHAAKTATGAASAISHVAYRNVSGKLLVLLSIGGVIGGILGAYILTGIDGRRIRPFVSAWLAIMGLIILWRAAKGTRPKVMPSRQPLPLGFIGGLFDAIGGGGWGPIVTSTLLGSGADPRKTIGTVNTAEFFVAVAVSAAFLWSVFTGRWEANGLQELAWKIAGSDCWRHRRSAHCRLDDEGFASSAPDLDDGFSGHRSGHLAIGAAYSRRLTPTAVAADILCRPFRAWARLRAARAGGWRGSVPVR